MKYCLFKMMGLITFFIILISNCKKVNNPPNGPTAPSGPATGFVDSLYDFSSSASDSDGNDIAIRFDWGDGDTSDWGAWIKSGNSISMSHSWSSPDIYYIRAQAKDLKGEASDWSQGCSLVITEVGAVGTLRWRYEITYGVSSSPAVGSDGTIYVNGESDFYAINSDGSLKWRLSNVISLAECSPTIDSDTIIYFVTLEECGFGYLFAYDNEGVFKWRSEMIDGRPASPALGSDGTIYVGTANDTLHAFNPNGTLKWQSRIEGGTQTTPAIGSDGTIYIGTDDGYFYAINPDGSLKWRCQVGKKIGSSPAIGSDGTIYFGCADSCLYVLNPDSTIKWRYRTNGWIISSPAIDIDGTIYFGSSDKHVYAINSDGTIKWRFQTNGWVTSSPAISSDGIIYIGSDDKNIYAINSDGSLKWRYATGRWVESSPAIGMDGTIYIVPDGYLYAIYGSGTLANSSWPMYHHDLKHTSRVGVSFLGKQ